VDLYFQLCVAMASGHFNIWTSYLLSPWQHPPRHVNRVLLPRGQLGRGLKLVGGRGYGVFIHSHRHTSSGLQTGDQVSKVTSLSTWTLPSKCTEPSPTVPAVSIFRVTISGRWKTRTFIEKLVTIISLSVYCSRVSNYTGHVHVTGLHRQMFLPGSSYSSSK